MSPRWQPGWTTCHCRRPSTANGSRLLYSARWVSKPIRDSLTWSKTFSSLHMRPGGWRIDIAGTAVKTFISGSILAAALFVNGAQEIPAELLPAVLPLLIDVQRVRLDRRDRELLIPLRQATNGIEGMAVSPRVLYNRLDAVTQDELNYDDFAAFCTRLVEAGELDDAGLDDVRPRSAGAPAWIRITWT